MIDRSILFDHVRRAPANGHLTAEQVDGIGRIVDEWERRALVDARWLAYELATGWHETGGRMQPVREGGSAAYLRAKPYWPWTGRGLVQVTWERNGRKFGARVPDDLLTWPVALRALFDGMIGGVFTGRKLATYFGPKVDDPVNARRIINGTDRAALVAGYHAHFLAAIRAASGVSRARSPASPARPREPAPPAAAPAPSFWTRVLAALNIKAA